MNLEPIGYKWHRVFYPVIRDSLGFDQAMDEEAANILSNLLSQKRSRPDFNEVKVIIESKKVIMFGAGPSLDPDIEGLRRFIQVSKPVIVAADGAANALYSEGITSSIIVSDLDSCSEQNLILNSERGFVFAHAHGDNIELLKKIIPNLGPKVIGTTQTSSVSRVKNFGGLTDGDRACFVVSEFNPSALIIAGMDFGNNEGRHSINKYVQKLSSSRRTKLSFGKQSLEFLIRSRTDISFVNVTLFGEPIEGAPKMSYEKVTSEFS